MVDRSGYVAGLRDLANRLERYEDCPLPAHGKSAHPLLIVTTDPDRWAHAVEAFPDGVLSVGGYASVNYRAQLHGLTVDVTKPAPVKWPDGAVMADD